MLIIHYYSQSWIHILLCRLNCFQSYKARHHTENVAGRDIHVIMVYKFLWQRMEYVTQKIVTLSLVLCFTLDVRFCESVKLGDDDAMQTIIDFLNIFCLRCATPRDTRYHGRDHYPRFLCSFLIVVKKAQIFFLNYFILFMFFVYCYGSKITIM